MVIVRHGQTAANAARRLQGLIDLPLDETGERQAQLVAQRISREIAADALISSPLIRARTTALAISSVTGLDIQERANLKEMHFGDLEGLTVDEFSAQYPELAERAFDPHNLTLQWPNGDHIAEFYQRSHDAFTSIAEEHQSQTVVVVAHGGLIGSYLRAVAGEPLNGWRTYGLRNCGISIVEVANGVPTIVIANDCAHLDEELAVAVERVRR
ncbi:MAG: histidine phosphatase family protein [Thermomicrobiales bacterium]|nr:histidine phosphatase family protein [Thermomicrobiales bacterium]MCO5221327.1 histidine phosphatase family protein [Thermomicrobiales bacterium]